MTSIHKRNNAAKRANNEYRGAIHAALDLPSIKPLRLVHKLRINQALLVHGYLPSEQLEKELVKLEFLSRHHIKALVDWHIGVTPKLQVLRSGRPT